MHRFILYAPNVGVGGGLVLLRALLNAWPADQPMAAILDERGRSVVESDGPAFSIHWVTSSFSGRWRAERLLAQLSGDGDGVFCFHNLPPVLPNRGHVICYVHNPNLVGLVPKSQLSGWVRFRCAIERFIFSRFAHRIHRYLVQTPTMAAALRQVRGRSGQPIDIMPFVDPQRLPERRGPNQARSASDRSGLPAFDFIYVSDGAIHKNHPALFRAWELLAEQGVFPSLALTLHPVRDKALRDEVDRIARDKGVRIVDLGQMPHEQLLQLYENVRALIFPSYAESFGIPLIEAKAAGLPILAAEMDFVRDVCEPTVTFDPHSPRSIARAVRRFLDGSASSVKLLSPGEFVLALLACAEEGAPRQTNCPERD